VEDRLCLLGVVWIRADAGVFPWRVVPVTPRDLCQAKQELVDDGLTVHRHGERLSDLNVGKQGDLGMVHVEGVALLGWPGLNKSRYALVRQVLQLRNAGQRYAPGEVNFLRLQRLQLRVRVAEIADKQA